MTTIDSASSGPRTSRGTLDDVELTRLLKLWVENTFPDDGDGVRRTFVEVEFGERLQSYQKSSRTWRAAQVSLWSVVALLGLLISVFAGLKTGHGFTLVAGSVVALLTTLTNALHPAQQADGYQDARLALRDQGWSLLMGTDGYSDNKDGSAHYEEFAEQVRTIVATKRTATKFTLGATSSGG